LNRPRGGKLDDVADNKNPDAIQREIEATRAELADTIDAIAERVSPRKAASRGAAAMKAQVSSAFGHGEKSDGGTVEPGHGPTALDAEGPITLNGRPAAVLDATAKQASRAEPVAVRHERTIRTDRVLLTVGMLAAAVGIVVLVRSKRS
jgi:hypothetical protein